MSCVKEIVYLSDVHYTRPFNPNPLTRQLGTWHHISDRTTADSFWKFHYRNVPPNRAELSVNEVLPLTTIFELDANRAPDHYGKGCLVELTNTLTR